MLNLIKMDLYRLFRTKSFKIGLIISLAISFLFVAVVAAISNLIPLFPESTQAAMSVLPFADWRNNVNLFELILSSTAILSLLVSAVLASNFISADQANGYVKNIAGQLKNKGMMNVSKFVALAVMTFFVLLAYTVGSTIGGLVFLNNAVNYEGLNQFLAVFGTKYLIYLAVNAIILFLCTLTKSKSVSIAFGALFGSGATVFAYSAVSTFAALALKCDVNIASYIPDGLIFGLTMDAPSTALIKAIVVGVVYIAVFMVLSMILMKKRDTK